MPIRMRYPGGDPENGPAMPVREPRKKVSVAQQVDELALAALNTLLVAANKGIPPKINVPYITMCFTSGRTRDITDHLRKAQIEMEKEGS